MTSIDKKAGFEALALALDSGVYSPWASARPTICGGQSSEYMCHALRFLNEFGIITHDAYTSADTLVQAEIDRLLANYARGGAPIFRTDTMFTAIGWSIPAEHWNALPTDRKWGIVAAHYRKWVADGLLLAEAGL